MPMVVNPLVMGTETLCRITHKRPPLIDDRGRGRKHPSSSSIINAQQARGLRNRDTG